MKNLQFKTKISILLCILILVPGLFSGLFFYNQMKSGIQEKVLKGNQIYLELTERQLNKYFFEREGDGKTLASSQDVYYSMEVQKEKGNDSDEWRKRYQILDSYLPVAVYSYGFADLFLTDLSGQVIYAVNNKAVLTGWNISRESYFKEALSGNQSWSELFYSETLNENILILATPVYNMGTHGDIIGSLNIIINQQILNDIVHQAAEKLGVSGDAYLVNEKGLLLTNTLLGNYTENAALRKKIQTQATKMLSSEIARNNFKFKTADIYKDYLGNLVLGGLGIVLLADRPVGLIIEVDAAEAFENIYIFKAFYLLFLLLAAAAVSVIAGYIIKKYLNSISAGIETVTDTGAEPVCFQKECDIGNINIAESTCLSIDARTNTWGGIRFIDKSKSNNKFGIKSIFKLIYLIEEINSLRVLVDALKTSSHEFNNKLHVLLGLIQLGDCKGAEEYILGTVQNHGQMSGYITGRIRDASVAALLLGKYSAGKEKGIDIYLDPVSYLEPLRNYADREAIITVLGNLIENACEAVKNHGIQKEISVLMIEKEKNIIISVKDNGKGIPEEYINKIFERGFTTKEGSGGIGLSLIKNIAENRGGIIKCHSKAGSGTHFVVRIPKSQEAAK